MIIMRKYSRSHATASNAHSGFENRTNIACMGFPYHAPRGRQAPSSGKGYYWKNAVFPLFLILGFEY